MLLIFASCNYNDKQIEKFNCVDAKFGITKCTCSDDTSFVMYFDQKKNEMGMCIWNTKSGYHDFRLDAKFNVLLYDSIITSPSIRRYELIYSSNGKLLSQLFIDESLREQFTRNFQSKSIDYSVYYFLPNLKIYVPVYSVSYDTAGKMLPAYMFYRKTNSKSYEIVTDFPQFLSSNKNRDSMYVEYHEGQMEKVKFENPEEGTYYPNFKGVKTNKNYNSLKNIHYTNDSIVVGTLWSFFGKKGTAPYAYQHLIFKGDMMLRLTKFREEADYLQNKYPDNSALTKQVRKKLLKSGFVIVNGKIQKSKELESAIEMVNHD